VITHVDRDHRRLGGRGCALAHLIAGSSEVLYVVFLGERGFADYLIKFLLPLFIGNSIGSVALVAALAHAQHARSTSPDASRTCGQIRASAFARLDRTTG
jgi:hypothetical protein